MDGREAVFFEYRGWEAVSGSMDRKGVVFVSFYGNEAALVSTEVVFVTMSRNKTASVRMDGGRKCS
jgi:hypothetical protein